MDEYRIARRELMAEVSGWRVQGKPRLRLMDGVKVALGNRGMTVEAARKRSERVESPGTYVTESVLFRTAISCSGGYHLERSGMPLHAAVGVNCKNDATTENQGAGDRYMG